MPTTTHPHPLLVDPGPWCTRCHHHLAAGTLCPVCLDDRAHGIDVKPTLEDGKGTE